MDTELNIPKYRKKPIVVEAMQVSRTNYNKIIDWGNGRIMHNIDGGSGFAMSIRYAYCILTIKTSTGTHTASEGDWIVKGINDEFYAMPDDTFKELYEPADENTDCTVPVIDWMEKV